MLSDYQDNGYFLLKGLFNESEIDAILPVIDCFHAAWQQQNQQFYTQKAVNSAYLTNRKYLSAQQRQQLFSLLASHKIMDILPNTPIVTPAFMNTQLFFNPLNCEQKNYWHRDPQYHLTLAQQQLALQGPQVIHFRLALADEPGLELIPGTHKRWDNERELAVRLQRSGCNNFDDLSGGVTVPMQKGDLLVFSANMIHRGLYGKSRMALDILFCEATAALLEFVDDDCLPSVESLSCLQNPSAFAASIAIKRTASVPVVAST